jgi:hypothetical protein
MGTAIWDKDFDMSSIPAQEEILLFYETLKNIDLLYSTESVFCWIPDFQLWLGQSEKLRYPIEPWDSRNRIERAMTRRDYFDVMVQKFVDESEVGRFHFS